MSYSARYEGSCSCGAIDETLTLDGIPDDRHPEHQFTVGCIGCGRKFVVVLVEFGTTLTDTGLKGPDV